MELSKYEYDHFDMVTYYNLESGVELATVHGNGQMKKRELKHQPIWDEPVDKEDVPEAVLEVFSNES